jgi:hypothetical protein
MLLREIYPGGFYFNLPTPLLVVGGQHAKMNNGQPQPGSRQAKLLFGKVLVALQPLLLPERFAQEDRLGDVAGKVPPREFYAVPTGYFLVADPKRPVFLRKGLKAVTSLDVAETDAQGFSRIAGRLQSVEQRQDTPWYQAFPRLCQGMLDLPFGGWDVDLPRSR